MTASNTLTETKSPAHFPQLDGLRAIAIVFVLIQHGFPDRVDFVRAVPWGTAGVRLFFVLSGFLITKILLDCRVRSMQGDEGRTGRGHALRVFYGRRALRILPVYFFVLATMAAIGAPGVREAWIWLATFTSNLYFAHLGAWPGFVNHLWTIAVEEQFYLFWPFVIVFLPRRALVPAVCFAIALGPLSRAISVAYGYNVITTTVFTTSCFDSLGLGALLAIARHATFGTVTLLSAIRRSSLWLGVPLAAATLWLFATGSQPVLHMILGDLALALLFVGVVDRACEGFGGPIGRVLEFGPVRYLGKISYGLYLYHRFVRGLLFLAVTNGQLPPPTNLTTRFLRIVIVSLVISVLSWHLFEAPINRLKRFLPYERSAS